MSKPDETRLAAVNVALYYHEKVVGRPLIVSDEKRQQYPAPAIDEVLATARQIDHYLRYGDWNGEAEQATEAVQP